MNYIKSENLNSPKFNVSVRSVSGLKVEQVKERFLHKLARSSEACVIVHAGTNNLESGSVDVILDSYEDLANLVEKCSRVVFSVIIKRNDKPELNGKIDSINEGLYRLCTRKDVDYIDHDNIGFINLARDGINRSGQAKFTTNIFNLLT